MEYSRAQQLVGRTIAISFGIYLIGFGWLTGMSFRGAIGGTAEAALRYLGFFWLSLSLAPWSQLAPLVEYWPGNDPHNAYAVGATACGYLGAVLLMPCVAIPLGIIGVVAGKPAWGPLLVGLVSSALGYRVLRIGAKLQERAVQAEQAAA